MELEINYISFMSRAGEFESIGSITMVQSLQKKNKSDIDATLLLHSRHETMWKGKRSPSVVYME